MIPKINKQTAVYIKDQLKKYKAYFYALATLIGLGALKVIVGFIISK